MEKIKSYFLFIRNYKLYKHILIHPRIISLFSGIIFYLSVLIIFIIFIVNF